MKKEILNVVHFYNGSGGGVFTVIKNLLKFSDGKTIQNHIIHTINKDIIPHYNVEDVDGAFSQKVFYYSSKNNFFYTCKQLAKLLPDSDAVILAHDWLELGMVSNLGLQNPVVHILHGNYEYYYDLAVKNQSSVDVFLCVASLIEKELKKKLPEKQDDIYKILLPVAEIAFNNKKRKPNQILFLGRCEISKGYDKLPLIEEELISSNKKFHWHIIGSGSSQNQNQRQWNLKTNINYYGNLTSEKVYRLLPTFDFMVLPTLAEGMPLSIIEAMKAGVVPIVNDLEGGIREIIVNGENGFRVPDNDPSGFAEILIKLNSDVKLFNTMSQNAANYANINFDPVVNTSAIEGFIIQSSSTKKLKTKSKIYGSFLDEPWIPNWLVNLIRLYKSFVKKPLL